MLYKERLQKPYFFKKGYKRHSATFSKRGKTGVYQIFQDGELLYVGMSAKAVYKALYRHFQDWSSSKQQRVTYDPDQVKVRVTYTNTVKQAEDLEKSLIIKKKPRDNPIQYSINYDTDPDENKIYKEFIEENTRPVITDLDHIPF